MSTPPTDFYRAIGLDPAAPPHVLGAQITELLRRTPPGPNADYLVHARSVLASPDSKASYDAWLHQSLPTVPATRWWNRLGEHAKRFIGLGEIVLSPKEIAAFENAGVSDPGLRRLLAWRRSALFFVLPLLVLFSIGVVVNLFGTTEGSEYMTGVGLLLVSLTMVPFLILTAAVIVAIVRWTEMRMTSALLFWSWLALTLIPMAVFVLPTEVFYDIPAITQHEESMEEMARTYLRVAWIGVALPIALPVPFALVSGALRGVRKAKSLFPGSTLPGWLLSLIAPLYAVLMIIVYTVAAPLLDDNYGLFGVVLVAAAPLVFVVCRERYITPMTLTQAESTLRTPSLIALGCTLSGTAVLLIYALGAESFGRQVLGSPEEVEAETAWFANDMLVTMGLNFYLRFAVTSVVMTFLFVGLIRRDWTLTSTVSPEVRDEHRTQMRGLEHAYQ